MEGRRTLMAIAAAGLLAMPAAAVRRAPGDLPRSTLAARIDGAWRTIWSSSAPARLTISDSAFSASLRWNAGVAGVEWCEVALAGSGEAWRTRVIAARIDPRRVRLQLDTALKDARPAWTIARAPHDAVIAFNAGQFELSKPWGLVVLDGNRMLAAGDGPLASMVTIDRTGDVRLTHATHDAPPGTRYAFQSYPTLLVDGTPPAAVQHDGLGVDVAHRDARAAFGIDREGRVLVVLTRFDALGEIFGSIPFGLTTPEMAGLMLAFSVRDAVMLDGGISAQLFVRGADGTAHKWPGIRSVPLAVVGLPAP